MSELEEFNPDCVDDQQAKYARLYHLAMRYQKRSVELSVIRERATRNLAASNLGHPPAACDLENFVVKRTEAW